MWNRSRVAGVPDYAKIPFDNRTLTRRSVLERSLRSGPLEARRTGIFCRVGIFWRMHRGV
jgi:hypothetical protein